MSKAKITKKEYAGKTKDQGKVSPAPKLLIKSVFDWKPYLVLTIFAFILYANTLNNDYALDDAIVITNNQFTQKGTEGISDIFKYDTFTGFWMTSYKGRTADQIQEEKKLVAGGRYRPLSVATFAMEVEFFGKNITAPKGQPNYKGNPFISHLINIILYLFTTILLFIILKKLFPPDDKRKWYFSFPMLVSLLFLAHPIHTEAVANIKGRDEIMTLLGSLAALWFTLKYLDNKKFYYLILSSISLLLGLLSKENAITFLAIIPITVYYFTDYKWKENLKSFLPLLIAAGVFLLIRGSILGMGVQKTEVADEIMNNPFIHASGAEKLATIFYTLWMYIKLLIFPHPLTYDYYPHQIAIINWGNPGAFLPFLLYLAIGIYAVWGMIKKKDIFSYSIWFYLLPLSVVSNIFFPVGTFMNERFVFISSIGFCLVFGWLLYKYLPKLIKNPQTAFYVLGFIMITVLGLYSFKTIDRNKAWESDFVLFSTDVQVSVNSAKSSCSMGGKMIEQAQKDENIKDTAVHNNLCRKAIKYLERSVEIYPEYADALNLLGNGHFEYNKNVAKSLKYYNEVLINKPFHNVAISNARLVILNAYALLNLNQSYSTPDEILVSLQELIKTCEIQDATIKSLAINNPQHPLVALMQDAYHLQGTIYGRYKNQLDSAVESYRKAEALKINTAVFYRDFAVTQGFLNNLEESLLYFNKALTIDKTDVQTYINAAVTNLKLGDNTRDGKYYIEATKLLEQGVKLTPDNYLPYYYLGLLHQRLGNESKSKENYSKAIELVNNILSKNPQDADALRMRQEIFTYSGMS